MAFRNAIIGGDNTLVRQAIRSEGFVSGSAGWEIARDGSAEFQTVDIREVQNATEINTADLTAIGDTILNDVQILGDLTTGGIGEERFIDKTITETVNNSGALQDDDELVASVDAGWIYLFKLFLIIVSGSATPDLNLAFSFPAGSTLRWTPNGLDPSVSAVQGIIRRPLQTSTGQRTLATLASETVALTEGRLDVGGTAGNLQLRWSQNSATAEDTQIVSGSYLWIRKVALA